jgi:hypothetical protein
MESTNPARKETAAKAAIMSTPISPTDQRFSNRGVRFSTKAAMPSFWSAVANMA